MNKSIILKDRSTALGDALNLALADFLRLKVADGDASPLTMQSYYSEIGGYTEWCKTEGIIPAQAGEDDIITYRRWLVVEGYSPATIAIKLAAIRKIYDAAVWRGIRPDNPATGIKPPKDETAPEDKIKFLPLDGLRRLLALPDVTTDEGIRDRAILALMSYHGLRVAEVANLPLNALALDVEPAAIMVKGKRSKSRKLYPTENTAAILGAWLERRPAHARQDEARVFVSMGNKVNGKGMTTRALRYLVDKYLKQAGLKADGISCHSLRHSFATWSRAGGANLDSLQDALGHASGDTTRVYARIVDKMKENPTRYLEAMLTG
jgi:integrase/recombinase XerD